MHIVEVIFDRQGRVLEKKWNHSFLRLLMIVVGSGFCLTILLNRTSDSLKIFGLNPGILILQLFCVFTISLFFLLREKKEKNKKNC